MKTCFRFIIIAVNRGGEAALLHRLRAGNVDRHDETNRNITLKRARTQRNTNHVAGLEFFVTFRVEVKDLLDEEGSRWSLLFFV